MRKFVALSTLPLFAAGLLSQSRGRNVADIKDLLRDIYGDKLEQPWLLRQENARASTGVVILEKDDKLYLDSDPCNQKVMTFSKPYEKTDTGKTVTCKGHQLPLSFVEPR
jgi:hypothetical protein